MNSSAPIPIGDSLAKYAGSLPVVVDANGTVIDGNLRVFAARRLSLAGLLAIRARLGCPVRQDRRGKQRRALRKRSISRL